MKLLNMMTDTSSNSETMITSDFYHKHLYQLWYSVEIRYFKILILMYLLQLKVLSWFTKAPFDDAQFKSNFIKLYK